MPPAADEDLFKASTAETWKLLILEKSFSNLALHECLHVNLGNHRTSPPAPEELCLKHSRQTGYVIISGISALISEKQQIGQLEIGSTNFSKFFDALTCWHFTFARFKGSTNGSDVPQPDIFLQMIKVLWHTAFMELVTNFDILERSLERDGPDSPSAQYDLDYAYRWANSNDAHRCILHTHTLLNMVGLM